MKAYNDCLEFSKIQLDGAKNFGKQQLDLILANEGIPLFNRWNLFMKYGQYFLEVSSSIIGTDTPAGSFLEDLGYPEYRGMTVLFCDVMWEYWVDEECVDPATGERPEWMDDNIGSAMDMFEKIPEEVVRDFFKQGVSGHVFDW